MEKKRHIGLWIGLGCVLLLVVVAVFILFKSESVGAGASKIMGLIAPFLAGGCIAYILRPIANKFFALFRKAFYHKKFFKKPISDTAANSLANGLSVFCSFLVFLVIFFVLGWMIFPQVVESVKNLISVAPELFDKAQNKLDQWFAEYPEVIDQIHKFLENAEKMLTDWVKGLLSSADVIANGVMNGITSVFTIVKDLVIAIIVALNLLAGRRIFAAQSKMMLYAAVKPKRADGIMQEVRYADKVFTGFIVGRLLDALVIGILTYIFMLIMNMPYSLLISLIIGITNFIPFFGPFIGGIPSVLLLAMVDFKAGIILGVFIIILQQLDGNVIGPAIVGDRVGLRGVWVLFAVTFFGGIFGFTGMLFGVPVFSVIYDISRKLICKGLRRYGKEDMYNDYRTEFNSGVKKQTLAEKIKNRKQKKAEQAAEGTVNSEDKDSEPAATTENDATRGTNPPDEENK